MESRLSLVQSAGPTCCCRSVLLRRRDSSYKGVSYGDRFIARVGFLDFFSRLLYGTLSDTIFCANYINSYTSYSIALVKTDMKLSNNPVSIIIYLLFNMVPLVWSTPNVYDYDRLPGMHDHQDQKLLWDGIPNMYFDENFYDHLQNALGGVAENGFTLLVTAYDNDAGGTGPRAAPNFAAASNQIRQQHENRVRRLFSCIMSYIAFGCAIYVYAMRNFQNDGIALFRYIAQFGRLPFPPYTQRRMASQWENLNMMSARIPINNMSLFKLAEIIRKLGRRLNKTPIQMKQKFLMALPQQLSHIRTTQTQNRTHVGYAYPAFYPIWFPQNLAGQPHPFANQPDIDQLAKLLFPDFVEHVNQTSGYAPIRAPPKGMVSEVDVDTHLEYILECTPIDDDESTIDVSAIDSKHIKPGFKCNLCNGEMHGVYTRMNDGSIVTCATKLLGHKVTKSTKPVNALSEEEIYLINRFRKAKKFADSRKRNKSPSPGPSNAILSTTAQSDDASQSGASNAESDSDSELLRIGISALQD